jgi:hypothetical protein
VDLHLDANNYIEGLNIISNIMTNQQMFPFIQSSVCVIMLTNSQVFHYHHNAKTCLLRLVLFNYNHFSSLFLSLMLFSNHFSHCN